ncbi:hypothetical protein VUR80DRAFT_4434 [Thermomyces stellatus]
MKAILTPSSVQDHEKKRRTIGIKVWLRNKRSSGSTGDSHVALTSVTQPTAPRATIFPRVPAELIADHS